MADDQPQRVARLFKRRASDAVREVASVAHLLRVMAWNVAEATLNGEANSRLDDLAARIRDSAPDILFLNDINMRLRQSGGRQLQFTGTP